MAERLREISELPAGCRIDLLGFVLLIRECTCIYQPERMLLRRRTARGFDDNPSWEEIKE